MNPLFVDVNETVNWSLLRKQDIAEAAKQIVLKTDSALNELFQIPIEERSFDNTMLMYDRIFSRLDAIVSMIYLMAFVHPEESLRKEGQMQVASLSKYINQLKLNDDLYRSVKEYSDRNEAKALTGVEKKFLEDVLRFFNRNGFNLDKGKRSTLKKLQDELSEKSLEFSANIAACKDAISLEEEDMSGLPEDYLEEHKQKDGKYKIGLSYPSYIPFMKYAKSDQARKDLYIKFNTRASDKNMELLDQMILLRQKIAELLGYSSYAAYELEDKMAKNPENVWDFERTLLEKVKVKAKKDLEELLEYKKNELGEGPVQAWESSYYHELMLRSRYQLNHEKLKEYFELNNVINGIFSIARHLFDISFMEVKNPDVWHKDVRMFQLIKNAKISGMFYLDLFPREGKYSHAAHFGMIQAGETGKGYQVPVASLVCNFPKPGANKPSLLTHSDVETLFHEFGHLIHNLLTEVKIASMSGLSVIHDFVETPSQIMENWAWNYESLSKFAFHYETGEVLPKDLFYKMHEAKNAGSGIFTLRQIFLGMLDMTYHDKYTPGREKTNTDVFKELNNAVHVIPYVEGTCMQTSFDHLTGYAAGYYGYLWSKVYAQDLFSVFEKNGVMSQETGLRFRDVILSRGGSRDELEMVKEFLGREPEQYAFIKSLGL